MIDPKFQPGFRVSLLDCLVLIVGAIGSIVMRSNVGWIGFLVAFVVAHFFLFCNVFRVSRSLELTWSCVFIVLMVGTIKMGFPSWTASIILILSLTVLLIVVTVRKPSYHGVLWQRINPALPEWWAARQNVLD